MVSASAPPTSVFDVGDGAGIGDSVQRQLVAAGAEIDLHRGGEADPEGDVVVAGAAGDRLRIGDRDGVAGIAQGQRVVAGTEVDAGIRQHAGEGYRVGAGARGQGVDGAEGRGITAIAECDDDGHGTTPWTGIPGSRPFCPGPGGLRGFRDREEVQRKGKQTVGAAGSAQRYFPIIKTDQRRQQRRRPRHLGIRPAQAACARGPGPAASRGCRLPGGPRLPASAMPQATRLRTAWSRHSADPASTVCPGTRTEPSAACSIAMPAKR